MEKLPGLAIDVIENERRLDKRIEKINRRFTI
jgi:hypothetical protein